MVNLEKIQSPLFPKLYDAFLADDDPLSGEQEWRDVFDYQFDSGEDYCGYAMLDNGRVVGMLGMVFSQRWIEGEIKRFCNLHTWWIREDYRGRSLLLLRPVLKLQGYTITHFTPCDRIRAITKERLGFQDLNSQLRILLPLGDRFAATKEILFDESVIAERLAAHERRILQDHRPYRVGHLLLEAGGDYCYVLYTHVVRHRLPYCHIHYISNKTTFAKREPLVRSALLHRHSARFVALDERLMDDLDVRRSFKFWAPAHAVFKSSDVRPDQIDNLYSDVVFLKLTTLPDITDRLRIMAQSWWPFGRRRAN